MNGALFYASQYGSTAEYVQWIVEATGLPAYDVDRVSADPSHYDFVVIGTPVIYYKLIIKKWVKQNIAHLQNKPVILFTVSGAPAGAKLDGWIADSLPQSLVCRMDHVALRGKQIPKDLSFFDRTMLIIAGLKNPDRVARREEMEGFDYMDKSSIRPVVELIHGLQSREQENVKSEAAY